MDINLIKIDKIIDINRSKPASFLGFSVGIVPGTASAAGFTMEDSAGNVSILDWFIVLKFVNASNEDLIIENIQAKWIGKHHYRCRSISTSAYKSEGGGENDLSDLIQPLVSDPEKQSLFFPIILKKESEKIIRVQYLLKTYKRVFLWYGVPISFKKKEVKAPETYIELFQRAIIEVKINKSKKPLLLKI